MRERFGPIVKWAGGKSRLLPRILPLIPQEIETYAEPFAGGAAVFFALMREVEAGVRRIKRVVLSDVNPELACLYVAVMWSVESVIRTLSNSFYANTKERFHEIRALEPAELPLVERACRVLYLNRTCFNGLWRENRMGDFNVPFGNYANPRIVDPEGLRLASRALSQVETTISAVDYRIAMVGLGKGDFAYLDPPYVTPDDEKSAFTNYARGGFKTDDLKQLMVETRALVNRGGRFVLSNPSTDNDATWFELEGYRVDRLSAPRSIAANGGRADAREVLISTWSEP